VEVEEEEEEEEEEEDLTAAEGSVSHVASIQRSCFALVACRPTDVQTVSRARRPFQPRILAALPSDAFFLPPFKTVPHPPL